MDETREKVAPKSDAFDVTFKEVVGKEPYCFQRKAYQALCGFRPIIIRAPTGSGKSEAVLIPFLMLSDDTLPSQMIYSLPTRSLVEDLATRFRSYKEKEPFSVKIHHGKKPESPYFFDLENGKIENAVVTTIDQAVTSYACTPLSAPPRHGNIPAGAISSSFLVFDEVHCLNPDLGLQSALLLAQHAYNLDLPFAILSATLPDVFLDGLKKRWSKLEIVEPTSEDEVQTRRDRYVTLKQADGLLTKEQILTAIQDRPKAIVVCNTVNKAIELYRALEPEKAKLGVPILLLHSRFLPEHRQKIQEDLKDIFHPDSTKPGILIATQVIEVGLDISSPLLLTELCPIDALIQRAGRCARRGGQGLVMVFDIEHPDPYSGKLVDETRKNLMKQRDKLLLDWETEKRLVNQILGSESLSWLESDSMAVVVNKLATAAFDRNVKLAAETVRENLSCQVTIHSEPAQLGDKVFKLKTVSMPIHILRNYFKKESSLVWRVTDNNIIDDESSKYIVSPIQDGLEILPSGFYILHPDYANYTPKIGFILERSEMPIEMELDQTLDSTKADITYPKETWGAHVRKVVQQFDSLVQSYRFALSKYAKALSIASSELIQGIRLAVALHDLGKLNFRWQQKVGWDGEIPLAHSGDSKIQGLPSHAPVSAYALSKVFYEWGVLGEALYFAVAHHHTVGASKFPQYKLISGWEGILAQALPDIDQQVIQKIIPSGQGSVLNRMPELRRENPLTYRLYTVAARLLKLSDWLATKGAQNDALLRDEN